MCDIPRKQFEELQRLAGNGIEYDTYTALNVVVDAELIDGVVVGNITATFEVADEDKEKARTK